MSTFEVIHRGRERDGYIYEIRRAGRRIADFWHNHRNEEHMIRKSSLGAQWVEFEDILEGGGPQPLLVSAWGADVLSNFLADGNV